MFKILLALHLITAIFAIGPLAHAATTAARGLRTVDSSATTGAARTLTLYSYASVLVVLFGFGLMSMDSPYREGEKVAEMSEPFIWLSAILWLLVVGLVLGLIVPTLQQATAKIEAGEAVDHLRARVAAPGGIVGLILAGIVLLMVYKPGS